MAECYAFPILSAEECVTFLRENCNTIISEEDFKKPDARRWQIFYGTVFELMTGHQADLTAQARLHTVCDSEYNELHEESFALMSFTMAMQQTMAAAKVTDFTIRDLLEPKPKRLLRIMSGAINFIRFQMFQEEVFHKKKEELERKREGYDFVLKENAELKKTLQATREAHASHMMKVKQLQEENETISARIQEQHKQREVLQRNLSEIKSELSQRNAANDQLKVNILTAQGEGDKLSQRIVQSPERVKTEQDRAKNRIMALRSTVEEKHRRLVEVQRQKEGMVLQQQNADKAVRLLRDISIDSDRLAALEKEVGQLQEARQDLRSSSVALTSKRDNLRQVLASRHEKLSKLDLQYHNKKSSIQEHISQLSQMKETLHDPRRSSESKKSELMKEKDRLKADVRKREEELENKLEQTSNLYFEILQQVDKKNIDIANGFGQFRAIMKT